MSGPGFSDRTIRFLRALKRNNHREWFQARRAEYDAHVHAPMVAVIEQLAVDFAAVAPQFVATPRCRCSGRGATPASAPTRRR